jgi:hypothetical protein
MKRVQDRINDAAGAWGKEWRGGESRSLPTDPGHGFARIFTDRPCEDKPRKMTV